MCYALPLGEGMISTGLEAAVFGVIFDNDGVLVDTEAFSEAAYCTALAEQGVQADPADAARYCGLTDADILRDLESRMAMRLDFERFSSRKRDLYFDAARHKAMRVFPGVRTLLDQLKREQVPIALASSAPRDKIEFNLAESGLAGYFGEVVSGEDFVRGKPDPEIFLTSARQIGVPAARCIVFEDSINGLKAARSAGMLAVGVSNTFPVKDLQPFADEVLTTLENITVEHIAHWMRERLATANRV